MPYRIAHAHNNGYPYPPRVKDKLVELYFHLTQKHVLTHRLCCSSLAGDWFFRCKGYNVIPNSIEFKRFKKSDNERYRRRMELGLSDKSFVVGFCGRLVEQKNPLFVIDIFKEIHNKNSNAILLIVGDGRLREEINDRVQQYELSNAVILCGAVNDVENYLSAMDVFLLPSRFEGFGISLLEAQAAGLECYTSEKVVPTETNITNHVNFLSLKDSAETWADAILTGNIAHYDEFEKLENSNYSLTNLRKLFIEAIQM